MSSEKNNGGSKIKEIQKEYFIELFNISVEYNNVELERIIYL